MEKRPITETLNKKQEWYFRIGCRAKQVVRRKGEFSTMIKGPVHQEHVIPGGSAPRDSLKIPEETQIPETDVHKHAQLIFVMCEKVI